MIYASIVLAAGSPPGRPPLSAQRVKRRVQAFVLAAIVLFVAGGFAASHYLVQGGGTADDAGHHDAAVLPGPLASDRASSPAPSPTRTAPKKHVKKKPKKTAKPKKTKKKPAHKPAPSGGLPAESTAVRLTNQQRAQHGCGPLRDDARLRTAARRHSADMHAKHYFDHNSQDGTSPWDRIKAAGYSSPGAENIARGYATAQAVVTGWMNSPGHRANILNCKLKAVGIGVEYGSGGPWWTQDFGFE